MAADLGSQGVEPCDAEINYNIQDLLSQLVMPSGILSSTSDHLHLDHVQTENHQAPLGQSVQLLTC